jgi:hypothetical protein
MNQLGLLLNWRLHALVVIASIAAEFIGIQKFNLGPGVLLLLPLFYVFIFCLFVNPNIIPKAKSLLSTKQASIASQLLIIAILPFIAKFGTLIGPSLGTIAEAGPAMLAQELGNLGTLMISMPVAVLVLKMGREAIGATYSIAREPNIALISERYGLKGPEGVGVISVYVMGTMFGTLFFALLAGYVASLDIFDIRAVAMGCGVGSGSMTAACAGALSAIYPGQADEILAFAGASNLLTNATGLYVSIFVGLPFAEWLYKTLSKFRTTPSSQLMSNKD